MVFGDGPGAGAPLVQHPQVPLVSFTGGTATGERIYAMCAPLYKKMSLELGGKNASIVFEDADLQDAIDTTVRSCFTNSGTSLLKAYNDYSHMKGQICLCTSRLYVHSSLFEAFVQGLKAKTEALVAGDPFDSLTKMGPLVSQQHLDKVLSYVDIAVQEGGTILTGGKRLQGTSDKYGQGYYMTPTLITNLPPLECRTQQEEIFGPVVTITPFDTEEDAVRFANGTQFGLSACVWTKDVKRAHRMAKRLKVPSYPHICL
jgi:aminomuconate-semialdehyde/2-hydroxymuconate-6-semialdehyde dehydrogenase